MLLVPSVDVLRLLRYNIQLRVRCTAQMRHATLLRRPKRPYTFTQLITLSDGSAFTIRTTSPEPIYKTAKDTRNSPLWNPSSRKLLNVEQDEAGKLAAFRAKFGRGFDADVEEGAHAEDHLSDLIRAADQERAAKSNKVDKKAQTNARVDASKAAKPAGKK